MRIATVRIQNLRAFEDVTVHLDKYTCFVGPNGAGKSTVLCALNIFFRESGHAPSGQNLTTLTEEDFHGKDTTKPIRVTTTFIELNEEAKADFADYVRQDKLVVTAEATYEVAAQAAEVRQYGERLGIPPLAAWFGKEADGAAVKELTELYGSLAKQYDDLPTAKTKQAMKDALLKYESVHPELCELIPSQDQFYGFTKGVNRLEKHIQWVFVPAVKDATTEQVEAKNGALAKLLARAVGAKANLKEPIKQLRGKAQEEYSRLLAEHDGALKELSSALQGRLTQWAHPEATIRLRWNQDGDAVKVDEPLAGVLAGESGFQGELWRLGHGLQRCYIMALLQELAGTDLETGPCLVLACEEPELYQHPPQARHLGSVFEELSTKNAQVLVCTHSPHFVSGERFEGVRLVRKSPRVSRSTIACATWQNVAGAIAAATGEAPLRAEAGALAKIHQALTTSINEMFFTPVLVLVEGAEDIAYITTYLHLLGLWSEWRRLGCHLVATDRKSNMVRPLAVANALTIPTLIMFDADGASSGGQRSKHERDNKALLTLAGVGAAESFPAETIWKENAIVWSTELATPVEQDLGSEAWFKVKEETEVRFGQPGHLDKNPLFIADTLSLAWERGLRSETLTKACNHMIAFAQSIAARPAH